MVYCAKPSGEVRVMIDTSTYGVDDDSRVLGDEVAAVVEVLSAQVRSAEPEGVVDTLNFLRTPSTPCWPHFISLR